MKTQVTKRMLALLAAGALCISSMPDAPAAGAAAQKASPAAQSAAPAAPAPEAQADAGGILIGDTDLDGEITAADASAVTGAAIKTAPQADVNADGVLDETDSAMIGAYVSGEITYFPAGIYYDADAGFLTRAEWIHRLVAGMDMQAPLESEGDPLFTDIAENQYANDINTAAAYGIFDIMGDEFHPDVYVTRDFAAHSLNNCLGYANCDLPISFADADAVYYLNDAQLAVNNEWFTLQEGKFCPSLYVTAAEAARADAAMKKAVEETAIDMDAEETIVFADSVVDMTDAKVEQVAENKIRITEAATLLKNGQDFAFKLGGVTMVRRAKDIVYTGDYNLNTPITVTVTDADSELVTEAVSSGNAYIDFDNIKPLSDDIEIEVASEKPAEGRPSSFNGVCRPNKTLNITKKSGALTLSASLSNFAVPYSIEYDIASGFKKLQLSFDATATIEATLSGKTSGSIPLATVPIATCGVVSATLILEAYYSVDGSVTLGYSCGVGAGVLYQKGQDLQCTRNFQKGGFKLTAQANEKVGLKAKFALMLGASSIGEVYVSAGETGSITATATSKSAVTCLHVKGHIFAECGAKLKLPFIKELSKTIPIWDAGNSPLKLELHFENGKMVPQCTQGMGLGTTNGGSIGGGANGGWLPGSGYGSGYGYGLHGGGWLSKYYNSMMAFREMEPSLVIAEDMLLTEDLDVDANIVLQAKLDLNGHKLTAQQNVIFENNGSLVINGGSAEIAGDVEFTGDGNKRSIIMTNKDDYVKIKGTAHISKADSKFTAGTLEFAGDVINSYLTSSDMHKVIFSGTGDQTIGFSSSNIGMLEIKNSDSRTLSVTGMLHVVNQTSIDGKGIKVKCPESATGSIVRFSKINAEKITFDGDVILRRLEVTDCAVTVNGNVLQNKDGDFNSGVNIFLNKSSMKVNGNFVADNRLVLNDATMEVTGNYKISGYWIEGDPYSPQLSMKNRNDSITVGGNFELYNSGSASPEASNGTITVSGDITIGYADLRESCKVILKGDKDASIFTENKNTLISQLEIENADKRKIYVDGYLRTGNLNTSGKALGIISRSGTLNLGKLVCPELNVEGDVALTGSNNFMCDKVHFNGDVSSDSDIACNSPEIITDGVWSQTGGYLDIQSTAFTCKDFNMSGGTLKMNKGSMKVTRDFSETGGTLVMENAKNTVEVGGDLNFTGGGGIPTAGTFRVAGDITNPIQMGSAVKFVLCGEKDQTLSSEYYVNLNDQSRFGILSVENAADRKITFSGNLDTVSIAADADTLNMISDGGKLSGGKLLCNLDITGNVIMHAKTVDLNGKTVNITGDLYHDDGTLSITAGKLNISGDYILASEYDSAVHKPGKGILSMTNDKDYVSVGGSFETVASTNHSDYLTAGTLEIKGDFTQIGDGSAFAFPASGTHKVILSGDAVQHVTFESYDSSHFNILDLKQEKSQYEFSDDPCWTTLADGGDDPGDNPGDDPGDDPSGKVSGDVNEDGSVDLKDVTFMRRALAGGWDLTINEINADVNGDGSFDLKDVTVLRRYLAGGWGITLK